MGGRAAPVQRVNKPKKTGARSARARTRGQIPLVIQELYITATQVYDKKSTKIERNTAYKLSSIGRDSDEKNPGKDPPAIVLFCSGSTLIQSGSILSC